MKSLYSVNIEKTVYFIRHGQSEGNLGLVFQENESLLTKTGEMQAEHIARRMSKLDFDLLLSSPWMRARQTAEAIARLTGKQIKFSELFVERQRPSRSAGKSRDDQEARELESAWNESLYRRDLKVEDGENYTEIINRADQALQFLESQSAVSMAVVTHGYFLRTLMARVLLGDALTPDSFQSLQYHMGHENTGLTVIVYGERKGRMGWWLWIYNDHAHLAV